MATDLATILRSLGAQERSQLLQEQLRRAQEYGAPRPNNYTTPWGAGLGGLAQALRMGLGAYDERKAREGLSSLAETLRGSRGAFANAGQGLATSDADMGRRLGALESLPMETGAQAGARGDLAGAGLNDALRGALGGYGDAMAQQRGTGLTRMQDLGNTGVATGDAVLGPAGKLLVEQSMQGQQSQQRATEYRLKQAMAALEAQRKAAERVESRGWQTTDAETDRNFRAGEGEKNRASQERAAALSAGLKESERTGKSNVPGLEVEPGATPTEDDAKRVKSVQASVMRMRDYAKELRDLHTAVGTELTGPKAVQMKQVLTKMQLEGKNIGELGALSGPDMGIVEAIVGADPTSIGSNLKAVFGVDNTNAALDGLGKWVDTQEGAILKTYGYRKKGGGAARVPVPVGLDLTTPPPPSPGMKRIRDPQTGKAGWWDGKAALPPGVEVLGG